MSGKFILKPEKCKECEDYSLYGGDCVTCTLDKIKAWEKYGRNEDDKD